MYPSANQNSIDLVAFLPDLGKLRTNASRDQRHIVSFRGETNSLVVKGSFDTEHATAFSKSLPILIQDYFEKHNKLTCYFHIKSTDRRTIKTIMTLFRSLEKHKKAGKIITINWFADWFNNDIIETGSDLAEMHEFNINILPL